MRGGRVEGGLSRRPGSGAEGLPGAASGLFLGLGLVWGRSTETQQGGSNACILHCAIHGNSNLVAQHTQSAVAGSSDQALPPVT